MIHQLSEFDQFLIAHVVKLVERILLPIVASSAALVSQLVVEAVGHGIKIFSEIGEVAGGYDVVVLLSRGVMLFQAEPTQNPRWPKDRKPWDCV